MADARARRRGKETAAKPAADEAPRRSRREGASSVELAKRARDQLAEITGLDAESVTSLARADDGRWLVTVDLLELARVPETDDVLGSYEAELDADGELLGYRRLRRYPRSQAYEQTDR